MRAAFLPYCEPLIGETEIEEVADSIRLGQVTTGPKAKQFERDFANYVGVKHAIAVSSGTAALHLALAGLDVGPGDEVIVPTLTFCATANVVTHLGARPVLVDVDENFQISLTEAARHLTRRTRAIVPVHYAGQPCDLKEILEFAASHGIEAIEDAAQATGAEYDGRKIGCHARAAAFSFCATNNMTTGEGGMLTTGDDKLAARTRTLSMHGVSRDPWDRHQAEPWQYEVHEAGYKYNMTDIQAAMGIHQLRRLDGFIERRREMAQRYSTAFADLPGLVLPQERPGRRHCYHLYPVRVNRHQCGVDRDTFIGALKKAGIGAMVHFVPLHRQPLYRSRYGYQNDAFPVAEKLYSELVSLPLYPKMSDDDVKDVISAVRAILLRSRKVWGGFGDRYPAAS